MTGLLAMLFKVFLVLAFCQLLRFIVMAIEKKEKFKVKDIVVLSLILAVPSALFISIFLKILAWILSLFLGASIVETIQENAASVILVIDLIFLIFVKTWREEGWRGVLNLIIESVSGK